ncbi:hypothetical protein L2E82_40037 [Cichorium intybus]|uniref:Uncharacterized protein n=1 Tax=Cichorium intybus TaxID=13427 RepID=A0ACB9AKV7_CICIN|nr:hypothetical protein L2E82_40037 [Cichorium intybus]
MMVLNILLFQMRKMSLFYIQLLFPLFHLMHRIFLIITCFHYQAIIRGLLLLSLDDPHRKICTGISMAVASVASHDWPDEWPELLPILMKLINDQSNANAVNGSLRCLALLSADLDDN